MSNLVEYQRIFANDHVPLLMEASQVLWEAVDERTLNNAKGALADRLKAYRKEHGSAQMRFECRLLAPHMLALYDQFRDIIRDDLGLLYDWEFAPMLIEHCLGDDFELLPDAPVRLAKALYEEAKRRSTKATVTVHSIYSAGPFQI